jgi:DNA-binding winged helix-turn-helix (wHTH) protein
VVPSARTRKGRQADVAVPSAGRPAVAAFRLDGWIAEPSLNRLVRGAAVVRVEPKVMDVLTELAAHAGTVVPKARLLDAVWGREHLAESVLSRAVAELRRVLEDDARAPRYIETIPKRGYRLIARISRVADAVPPQADRGRGWLVAAGFAVGAALGWLTVRRRRRNAPSPRG